MHINSKKRKKKVKEKEKKLSEPEIYLAKAKVFYNENLKTLKKKIKDDTKWWKIFLFSWISKINIVKLALLQNKNL